MIVMSIASIMNSTIVITVAEVSVRVKRDTAGGVAVSLELLCGNKLTLRGVSAFSSTFTRFMFLSQL